MKADFFEGASNGDWVCGFAKNAFEGLIFASFALNCVDGFAFEYVDDGNDFQVFSPVLSVSLGKI